MFLQPTGAFADHYAHYFPSLTVLNLKCLMLKSSEIPCYALVAASGVVNMMNFG
jgi:hypothetical protein